jgi:hypothetical protein
MQGPAFAGTQVGSADRRIKKPISGRPEIGAQFQLWIFSYTILARSSKKWVSRVLIGPTITSPGRERLAPVPERRTSPNGRCERVA